MELCTRLELGWDIETALKNKTFLKPTKIRCNNYKARAIRFPRNNEIKRIATSIRRMASQFQVHIMGLRIICITKAMGAEKVDKEFFKFGGAIDIPNKPTEPYAASTVGPQGAAKCLTPQERSLRPRRLKTDCWFKA